MNLPDSTKFIKALDFAARKHRFQTRKDKPATPYINHPISVALTLAEIGQESDTDLLTSAVLHDTIEDTETTPKEIEDLFGAKVLALVLEVTDDKSLPKEERKRLQVVNAQHKSMLAKRLKLADKICNITDILNTPPNDWSQERKLDYLTWVEKVMVGLRGANPSLESHLAALIEKGRRQFGGG